ncbi:MAG: hypothetical protein WAM44_11930, partial [Chthoniobacterales bacterium]
RWRLAGYAPHLRPIRAASGLALVGRGSRMVGKDSQSQIVFRQNMGCNTLTLPSRALRNPRLGSG